MAGTLEMKLSMVAVGGAASIEADQTDIQARFIIDRIKALRAVLAIYSLTRLGWTELKTLNVCAGHFDSWLSSSRGLCFA